MKILSPNSQEFEEILLKRKRYSVSSELFNRVAEIIQDVRGSGDEALCRLTEKFDNYSLNSNKIKLSENEIDVNVSQPLETAISQAAENIRAFHEKQMKKEWTDESQAGGSFGEIVRPVDRAGIYVPAGTAPLVSTVLMTVIPAQVAGVKEICVATPPDSFGDVNNGILTACKACGVSEIYRIGGAQAVAALAFGTNSVKPVDVIAGPGNKYVTEAKRQVFGCVGVDLIAGPSESLIIVDDSAVPEYVAADILSQAEHLDSSTYLVSVSKSFTRKVGSAIKKLLESEFQYDKINEAVDSRLFAVNVESLDDAAEISNLIAPEHLQIITKKNTAVLKNILHAGAVFLGNYSPVPLGDFVAGPSHVLPTGGAARYMSGLSTDVFVKRMAVMECSKKSFAGMADSIAEFGKTEKLPAHEFTATIRKFNFHEA